LQEKLGILQSTLSQQLTISRGEALVRKRRDSKNISYQIANPQALAIISVLFDQICGPQAGESA
jgi:DNA-binding transcriptional ArsR family regulator